MQAETDRRSVNTSAEHCPTVWKAAYIITESNGRRGGRISGCERVVKLTQHMRKHRLIQRTRYSKHAVPGFLVGSYSLRPVIVTAAAVPRRSPMSCHRPGANRKTKSTVPTYGAATRSAGRREEDVLDDQPSEIDRSLQRSTEAAASWRFNFTVIRGQPAARPRPSRCPPACPARQVGRRTLVSSTEESDGT